MTRDEILKALAEPFDPSLYKTLKKGGQNLTYVPVSEYIARLNAVLGADCWDEDTEVWRDPEFTDWELAKTKLSVKILGEKSTKTGLGGQKIKFTNGGAVVDLGDELKGAASDSFKKACTKYGMGLELARSEEALQLEWERANPPADESTLNEVFTAIDALDDAGRDKLKKFWTDQKFPNKAKLTPEQARKVLAHLAETQKSSAKKS